MSALKKFIVQRKGYSLFSRELDRNYGENGIANECSDRGVDSETSLPF